MEPPKDRVYYNDTWMARGWPERIQAAQREVAYEIRGRSHPRIPYGREGRGWPRGGVNCHDCGVLEGQLHVPGCDMERCPCCRGQYFLCDCNPYIRD